MPGSKIVVDLEAGTVTDVSVSPAATHGIGSPAALALLNQAWLRSGWDAKYVYSFTWLGRPIIQLPDDLLRMQEVVFAVRPDVIIETGVAHGGGLVFYASLCKLVDRGRVIGVDVEIRPHNRRAIDAHPLRPLITLVDGSSTDPNVVDEVRSQIGQNETVLVALDSRHTRDHVLQELEAYAPLVSVGSYIVAMDGILGTLARAPRVPDGAEWDNPRQAAEDFVAAHPNFAIVDPPRLFDESLDAPNPTYWPSGFIRRMS